MKSLITVLFSFASLLGVNNHAAIKQISTPPIDSATITQSALTFFTTYQKEVKYLLSRYKQTQRVNKHLTSDQKAYLIDDDLKANYANILTQYNTIRNSAIECLEAPKSEKKFRHCVNKLDITDAVNDLQSMGEIVRHRFLSDQPIFNSRPMRTHWYEARNGTLKELPSDFDKLTLLYDNSDKNYQSLILSELQKGTYNLPDLREYMQAVK